jgi:hypothetical protein
MASVGTPGRDNLVGLDDKLVQVIRSITDEYIREDRDERDVKKSLWLKLENYFAGRQRIYYDMVAKDWRGIDETTDNALTNRHYDKVINNYRAHAESIIAALSVKPPSAIFYPADADEDQDITTARVAVKLKEKIEEYNNAQMLIIKALMILFNQGVVAAYVYKESSNKYGHYTVPQYGDAITYHTLVHNCPECGSNMDSVTFRGGSEEDKEHRKTTEQSRTCEVCGYAGAGLVSEYEEAVPEITGSKVFKKARPKIEVFGPLFVIMPFYAREQSHIPYLRLRFEQHYSALKNLYPKLKKRGFTAGVDTIDSEDRDIMVGTNSHNLCTVDCWWVRPWAYDVIDGYDDEIKKLKEKFPDGFYAVIIDDQLCEIHNEALDDHWVISNNPMSTYIHADPLGKPLAPITDLQNEIMDLQIETFEHAIPETFARGDVLDFKKYADSEAKPGMIYPVNPPAEGQSLGDSFHSVKTATLSEEADLVMQRLDNKAQFVSAAFPSIYGGPASSGSKTASEYTQSRAMALQRLSLTWNILKYWWADVMSIAVPLYMRLIKETGVDEKFTDKTNTGFVSNWIRQADLEGSLGEIKVDVDENLPMTPAALKDIVIQLMGLKDERVADAMFHPNNVPLLTKALGAPDLYIPGADSREKQFTEFGDLLSGIAVEIKDYEEHEIEAEVCQSFLISATGMMLKKQNPEGIALIEEHYAQHKAMLAGPQVGNPEEEEAKGGGTPNSNPQGMPRELPPNVTEFPSMPLGRG